MKIGFLRKIYPYLSKDTKNIKWRNLTEQELNRAMEEKQVISNCYDEATRYALLASKKGRKFLKSRIKIQKGENIDPAYKIKLNINGKDEIYRATKNDYKYFFSDIYDNYAKADVIVKPYTAKNSRLSLAVNIAVSKMITKHPSMKPLVSKIFVSPFSRNANCEFNKPSNAFKWFTGKNPIEYGESGINMSLRGYRDETLKLLKSLGKSKPKNYSFVALTGFQRKKKINSWHTVPITNVNFKEKTVTVLDKRTHNYTTVSFD